MDDRSGLCVLVGGPARGTGGFKTMTTKTTIELDREPAAAEIAEVIRIAPEEGNSIKRPVQAQITRAKRDAERVVLRDGSSVVIRPLAAGDEAAIASWFTSRFAGLPSATLYARLFGLLKRLDPRAEPALARAGRFDHEAITASPLTARRSESPATSRPPSPQAQRSRLRWPTVGAGWASPARCSNGSRPDRGPSESTN